MNLIETMTNKLDVLAPTKLIIQDDSAQHAGHAGNTGGGHFTLTIVSAQFAQKSQIIRHRLIYQALSDLMPQQIHALSILAIATDEPN